MVWLWMSMCIGPSLDRRWTVRDDSRLAGLSVVAVGVRDPAVARAGPGRAAPAPAARPPRKRFRFIRDRRPAIGCLLAMQWSRGVRRAPILEPVRLPRQPAR